MSDSNRERILALARRIVDLSHRDTSEHVFFPEFLNCLLSAINAPAGMIWLKTVGGTLGVRTQQGLGSTGYHENDRADQTNASLLQEVQRTGTSQMFGAGELTDLPTPTPHLYVLTPLMLGTNCIGIVEVLYRPNIDPRARPGYLAFIEQMCGNAVRYLRLRERPA